MKFLLLLILLVASVLSPTFAGKASDESTWTVFDVHRSRSVDNTVCNWSLQIDQSSALDKPSTPCTFDVYAPTELGCDKNTFNNVPCSGDKTLQISAGWSKQGFVVMNIFDVDRELQGWFGWSDTALNSNAVIPKQTKSATAPENYRRSDAFKPSGQEAVLENATAWKVTGLERSRHFLWRLVYVFD